MHFLYLSFQFRQLQLLHQSLNQKKLKITHIFSLFFKCFSLVGQFPAAPSRPQPLPTQILRPLVHLGLEAVVFCGFPVAVFALLASLLGALDLGLPLVGPLSGTLFLDDMERRRGTSTGDCSTQLLRCPNCSLTLNGGKAPHEFRLENLSKRRARLFPVSIIFQHLLFFQFHYRYISFI